MKKRGFGSNKWNGIHIAKQKKKKRSMVVVLNKLLIIIIFLYIGFGGKLEPGETIFQAAHRELEVYIVNYINNTLNLFYCFINEVVTTVGITVFVRMNLCIIRRKL